MKHLELVLILLFNIGMLNFGQSQSFTDLDGKRITTVMGNNPYMTSKVLFGDVTQLKTGQQIEILGFESNKVRIVSNGVIGFISQDYIAPSDVAIAKELEKKVLLIALDSKKRKVDSLERLHVDSIFFIAKATMDDYNKQLFDKPSGYQIFTVAPGEAVLVRDFTDSNYLKVLHIPSQRVGYMYWSNVDLSSNLKDSINHTLKRVSDAEDKKNAKAIADNLKKRKADYTKRFGAVNAQKILDRKIWIGMSSEMAKIVLGEPEKNNRTVTANRVSEQWVYGLGIYYYFTNGVLTSWQD
jgi:hypothetical protein